MTDLENIVRSIRKGVTGILSLQQKDACWHGFPTANGPSEIWTTAFVVAHLQSIIPDNASLEQARVHLSRARHPSGGWSWGPGVPADADSTAWALLALDNTGLLSSEELSVSRQFLLAHRTGDRFSTFLSTDALRRYLRVSDYFMLDGWVRPHPDVSAAALLALIASEDRQRLIAGFSDLWSGQDSVWPEAYWWRVEHYTAAIALRGLSALGEVPSQSHSEALRSLRSIQLPTGGFGLAGSSNLDAFSTALAVEILARFRSRTTEDVLKPAIEALLGSQGDNGLWKGDYVLRIPRPYVVRPEFVTDWGLQSAGNTYVFDQDGLFASSLACYALATCVEVQQMWGSA